MAITITTRGNSTVGTQAFNLDTNVNGNVYGEVLMAQGTPPMLEINRQGNFFIAQDPTVRAAVVAIPSTQAVSTLQNNDTTLSYVLDRITFQVAANTLASSFGIVLNLQKLVATAATDVKNIALPNGRATYPGAARVCNALNVAVAADLWFSIGNTNGNAVASGFGTAFDSGPLEGRIIIRPGRQLHAACVASATNVTGNITFFWSEMFIPSIVG